MSSNKHFTAHAETLAGKILMQEVAIFDGQGEEYVDLAVLLGSLRALYMIHQTHHWQSQGKDFYGDHLLFQRLYEGIAGEIDLVAEKLVGLGGIATTNYFAQMHHMQTFQKAVSNKEQSVVEVSLLAEATFLAMGRLVLLRLSELNTGAAKFGGMKMMLTPGLENMIGGILDLHESHLYLLSQRLA
jgi:hypothetical protein